MTIGKRIRQLREDLNMTQEDVAKKTGVAIQTIFKYEKEIVTNIPLDKIELLAKALNVTPAYLMGWEENMPVCTPLKILRQKANLPLMELCEQYNEKYNTNLSYDALRLIEDGKSIPTGKILVNLADFFNVSVDYILGRTSPELNMSTLSNDEKQLLDNYNKLNKLGKNKTNEYVDDLLENTKYTQEDEFIDCDEKIYSVDIEDDTTYIAAYGGGVEDDDKTIYHP